MATPPAPLPPRSPDDAFTRALDAHLRRSSGQDFRRNSEVLPQMTTFGVALGSDPRNADSPTPVNTYINSGRRQTLGAFGSPTALNLGHTTNKLLLLQNDSRGFQQSFGRRGSLGSGNILNGTLSPMYLMGRVPQNTPAPFIDLDRAHRESSLGLRFQDDGGAQIGLHGALSSPNNHLHGQVIDSSPVSPNGISSFRIFNGEGVREFPTYFGTFSEISKLTPMNEERPELAQSTNDTNKIAESSKDQDVFD